MKNFTPIHPAVTGFFRNNYFPAKHTSLFILFFSFLLLQGSAQSITEIITNYNGYWKSAASSNNAVKPDNSHNLLAFSFNGTRYSTGVNDALLVSHGETFVSGDYRALPVQSINGTINSNTKVGVGALYDGVSNGAGNPPPVRDFPLYLSDGTKGLNIGTCIANLPVGTLFFAVNNVHPQAIGDGIPDMVITQTADPSSSYDRYEFTDIEGNRVGNYVDIVLTNITPVGRWIADFYEASQNPMTLAAGFTQTERPIRLWAADFSVFGINSSNIGSVAYFKINLSGTSDVAFVAYNYNTVNIESSLPVQFSSFTGRPAGNEQVHLAWQTSNETGTACYLIETSSDGSTFTALDTVLATGSNYTYTHRNAGIKKQYYRIRAIDQSAKYKFSKVIEVHSTLHKSSIGLSPNPATNKIIIRHPVTSGSEQIQIRDTQGNLLLKKNLSPSDRETTLMLTAIPKGIYQLAWIKDNEIVSMQFVRQ